MKAVSFNSIKATTSAIAIAALLFGCKDICDEPDIDRINGLKFELEVEGPNAWTKPELADLMFVRYVPFSDPLVADTLFIDGNNLVEGPGRFIINDFFPFRNANAPYFVTYDYIIEGFTAAFFAQIERIRLRGEYTGECDYINLQKSFFLNGDSLDMGGSDEFLLLTR